MAGDYSRFTFDPAKNYSAVLKQQGRVGLDSDANEHAEIQDRRWRAETMDIMGCCAVSDYTDDGNGFRITEPTVTGDTADFRIGVGRMYVDGLQVENHGTGEDQHFDLALEETRSAGGISYYDQPYHRNPKRILSPTDGKTDLVYLDAWQREVTALEDPDIREVALGGPDTDTRLQTVWQVKVIQGVQAEVCADTNQNPTWLSLTAPSAGRLTVTTVTPPPSDLPCELSPEGGYRGLENRLYRVEIHNLGTRGGTGATFKWSRDNASVAAAVKAIEEVPGDGVRVLRKLFLSSLGRDRYLRFRDGDWIEVLDDRRELGGRPGRMVRIAEPPDEAEQSVIVEGSPLLDFDASDIRRHTRVRRWDQREGVGTHGRLQVLLGTPIHLEDGIEITFSLASNEGRFRVGDYWVFAARTASGVDELQEAPPRGIHHHYCRLALVQWTPGADNASGPAPHDCRQHWPPPASVGQRESCCIVVSPGGSIQAAIDALPPQGGCVCLKAGAYEISAPISIRKSNVVLQGASLGAKVIRRNGFPLLWVTSSNDVRIKGLCFEAHPANSVPGFAIVRIEHCHNTELSDCVIEGAGNEPPTVGILLLGGQDIRIVRNRLSSVWIGIALLNSVRQKPLPITAVEVADNELVGPTSLYGGLTAILAQQIQNIVVRRNRISRFMISIEIALAPTGALRVEDNDISAVSFIGIKVNQGIESLTRSQIQGNRVLGGGERPFLGILITGLVGVHLSRNQVAGFNCGIALYGTVQALVADSRIGAPNVANRLAGIFCVEGTGNRLVNNSLTDNTGGILAYRETQLIVADNTIEKMASAGLLGVELREALTLSHNRFSNCGYRGIEIDANSGAAASIAVLGNTETPPQVTVESCQVLNTGFLDNNVCGWPTFGIWIYGAQTCRVQGNEVMTDSSERTRLTGDRALRLAGRAPENNSAIGSALVISNHFKGSFPDHMIEFGAQRCFDRMTFSNNICEHYDGGNELATVSIAYKNRGPHVIVMGNHVDRNSDGPAFDFAELAPVVFIGNVVSGAFGIGYADAVPSPVSSFNVSS